MATTQEITIQSKAGIVAAIDKQILEWVFEKKDDMFVDKMKEIVKLASYAVTNADKLA